MQDRLSAEALDRGRFRLVLNSMGEKNGQMLRKTLTVMGPDPFYVSSAICTVQTAVVFLEQLRSPDAMLFRGGVVTPACVLYNTDIMQRLASKGIKFELADQARCSDC